MLNIRKINPMARAIGTMAAIATLVGGITFAALQSNAVALGPNDIKTGTASLAINAGNGTCAAATGTSAPGFGTITGLTSSTVVPTVDFCLKNTGDVPLKIEGYLNNSVSSAVASGYINLSVSCATIGNKSDVLNTWYSSGEFFTDNPLAAGATVDCTANLSLNSSYPGSGGETVPTFNIEFIGNQS